MIKQIDSFSKFLNIVKQQNYKDKDLIEARQYGFASVVDVYKKIEHKDLCKYFIIYDKKGSKVLCTIALDRCGFLHFFVTKNLDQSNTLAFIRDIKHLAKEYVARTGSLLVMTANFYKEAQKLNKIIGFRKYKLYDDRTVWITKDS